jgi:hypothetical protein
MSEESEKQNTTTNENPITTFEKVQTLEIIETPIELLHEPDWRQKIKTQFNQYSTLVAEKGSQLADDLIFKNYYLNLPFSIVEQSNNKNTISVDLNKNNNLSISYRDRKMAVFGLTFSSVFFHFLRANSNFKIRWAIPYYVFYSVLLCRENLDPFL